jgi:serine/threonine protein kinase
MFPCYSGSPSDSTSEDFSDSGALTPHRALTAGFTLGPYVIETCIGQGAMAHVYRVRHRVLNKPLALKVLAPDRISNREARQRFLSEARASAAIQHPNVVVVADAGVVENIPYLAMELLEGETLAQHLERHGPLTVEQLLEIALPLLDALMAAHHAGVIHRDLKPANMFLSRGVDGRVIPKLLDFGVSKLKDPLDSLDVDATAQSQLIGSPLYFPPEVLHGSRALTERSDQYSFGVVMYECVTGQVPFSETELWPLLEAIWTGACVGPRTLVPSLPERLERLILRAMSVDPAKRFDQVRDLARELLEFGAAEDVGKGLRLGGSAFATPGPIAPPVAATVRSATRGLSSKPGRDDSRESPRLPLGLLLGAPGVALLVLGAALEFRSENAASVATAVIPASAIVVDPTPNPSSATTANATRANDEPSSAPQGSAPASTPAPLKAPPAALAAPRVSASTRARSTGLPAPSTRANPGPQPATSAASRQRARAAPPDDRELYDLFFPTAPTAKAERPVQAAAEGADEISHETPVLHNAAPLLD